MAQEALGPCIIWPTNLSGIIFLSLHFFAPTTLAFFQFKNMPYSLSSTFAPIVLLQEQCSLPSSLLSHSYLTLHLKNHFLSGVTLNLDITSDVVRFSKTFHL